MSLGGNYLFLCLLLSMVCFILGVGLPPTAALRPGSGNPGSALISLGLDPLVAHLFVFCFANRTIRRLCAPPSFLSSGITLESTGSNRRPVGDDRNSTLCSALYLCLQ